MYKSKLQELCQRRSWDLPEYTAVKDGPNHMPRFTATVNVHGQLFATPDPCKSSKDAQNTAARIAFDHFNSNPPPPSPSASPDVPPPQIQPLAVTADPPPLPLSPLPSSLPDPPLEMDNDEIKVFTESDKDDEVKAFAEEWMTNLDEIKAFTKVWMTNFKKAVALFEKDGCITTEQIDTVMESLGVSLTKRELQDVMRNADPDNKGTIELPKFVNFIAQKMKVVSRSSNISYMFLSLDTVNFSSLGKVIRTNENVWVDYGRVNDVAAHNFLHSFSHISYLPIRFFDDVSPSILHLPYSSSIVDHIATLKLGNIYPLMTYQFIDQNLSYVYVSETYRKLSKDLIDFVLHLHTIGKSLVHLDLENLCIRDDVLKLWGLRFSEADSDSRRNDFALVYSVIDSLFALGAQTSYLKMPYDFHALMSELHSGWRPEVLKNHIALFSAKEKVQFIKNLGDVSGGFAKLDEGWFEKALKQWGPKYGWKKKIKTRAVLECLNFPGAVYIDSGPKVTVNKSLIKLCRNAATHVRKSLLKYLRSTNSPLVTITYNDVECILMKDLEIVLTDFHLILGLNYRLHYFESF